MIWWFLGCVSHGESLGKKRWPVARYIICVHFGHSAHGCSKDPEVPSLYLHVYFFSPRLFATWLPFSLLEIQIWRTEIQRVCWYSDDSASCFEDTIFSSLFHIAWQRCRGTLASQTSHISFEEFCWVMLSWWKENLLTRFRNRFVVPEIPWSFEKNAEVDAGCYCRYHSKCSGSLGRPISVKTEKKRHIDVCRV